MQRVSADVAVVGGGPAGTIAAKRLAELDCDVTLIVSARAQRTYEGLSDRVLEALRSIGCHDALAAVGPSVARVATWNGETSSRNREHLVDRQRFDAALQADAAAAGARILRGRATASGAASEGDCLLHVRGDEATTELAAGFLLEARGRSATGGRAGRVSGPATVALSQLRADDLRRPRSAVASCPAGWAWFIALGDGTALLQVLVSAGRAGVPKRSGLETFFDALLAEVPNVQDWLVGTRPAAAVTARGASARLVRPLLSGHALRVGDAAVAVDPLSGHGVYEAIGSALAAVPVVQTLRKRPRDAAIAARFYESRAQDTFLRYGRAGRQFYASERRWSEEPFWRERRAWPADAPHPLAATESVTGRAEVTRQPVVADGFVVEREVIVTPDHPRGVWCVADVPLVPLLRFLQDERGEARDTVPAGAAAAMARSPQQVDLAYRWLAMRGLVPPASPRSNSD